METMASGSDEPELNQRTLFQQWTHLIDHTDLLQTRLEELKDRFHSEWTSVLTMLPPEMEYQAQKLYEIKRLAKQKRREVGGEEKGLVEIEDLIRGTKRESDLVQNDIEEQTEKMNSGVKSLDEKSRELKMKEVIEYGRRLNAIKESIEEVMKGFVSKQEQVKIAQKSLEECHEEIQSKKAILGAVEKVCYNILESKEKTDFVCGEIPTILQSPSDPTKLVFDAMQGFYTSHQTMDTTEFVFDLTVSRSNLMGTTIIIVMMKDKIFIGSDSRITSRISNEEQMILLEIKKVYEIVKEPPILATFAGNVSCALQLIRKLQSEAQKLGQHLIEDIIKSAETHVKKEKPRRSFAVFICCNDVNDPTFPGHHFEYTRKIMHVEHCKDDDCRCPCEHSTKYSKMNIGVFAMGSGAFTAINYFDKEYGKRLNQINSYYLSGDLGVEQEIAKDDVFHALFKAALESPSTGPPFRVDSIINGQVVTDVLNFIPAYERFRQTSREYERGYHLFMVYPRILEGYNHGDIVFKNFPIPSEKVIDAGFRLATLKGDHILRLVGFGMEQHGEYQHALQALEKCELPTCFMGVKRARWYELEVDLKAEIWNKNLYNEVWNKKKCGSNTVIRTKVFMGRASLQFLNGLAEVYKFRDVKFYCEDRT